MQTVPDESSGGAAGPLADSPRGVLDHPEGVTATASGWQSPIGTLHGLSIQRVVTGELEWDRISIDEMRLARAAALLLVQGLPFNRLFPPDLTVYEGARAVLWFRSPPLLLRREETHLFQVPPKVTGVVLGVVVRAKELSEDQIRAAMLESVLG